MRDDAAQIQAIEAILVAVALVGSATMVVMYSQPATPPDGTRQSVGRSVEDSMDTLLDDQMALPGYGDSQLSRAIALCLMDDCEPLQTAIAGSLPADARFNAYLSNGYGEIPLIRNETPSGEAVAITRLVEPKWSYTFLGFDYNYSDPTLAQPLNVFALPVVKSNALTEGGTPVGVTVTGIRKDTGEEVRFNGFGSTLQRADARETTTPAVSVFFVHDDAATAFLDRTGAPTYHGDYSPTEEALDAVHDTQEQLAQNSLDDTLDDALSTDTDDVTNTTDDVTTDGTEDEVTNTTDAVTDTVTDATDEAVPGHEIVVRVVNSGDAKVDAGTPIRVELPRDWTAVAPVGDNAAWILHENATDRNGTHDRSHVRASLVNDLLPGALVNLTLKGTFHGANEDYRVITAEFGKNGRARAEALLRGADHVVPPATDQPHLAVNVPKPVGWDTPTTWAFGFVAPLVAQSADDVSDVNPDGLLDVGVTVTRIDVWGWNTHGLFTDVTDLHGLDESAGDWSVVDGNFTWRGNVDVHRDAPLNVRFNATAAELLNAPIARHVGAMPVEFDAWRAKLVQQFEYGFLRGPVYPAESEPAERPGHATDVGTHTAVGIPQWQSQALRGVGNYHVRDLPAYRDAAAGGWIKPDARDVRIGDAFTIEADVGSLLRKLQDVGSSHVNVTLRVYGPFTVEKKEPLWERSLTTSGDGETITDLVTWDVHEDGYGDVVVGTSLGRVYVIDGLSGTVDESRMWDADPTLVEPPAVVRLVRGAWNGAPALYVGTAAEGVTPRVHVLNANLTSIAHLPAESTDGTLLALHAGTDFDGDGAASVLASFSNGATYRLGNAPHASGGMTRHLLHQQNAAGAAKLAALEHLGTNGPAGVVIATDAGDGEGTLGAVALTDTQLEQQSGNGIVLEAVLSPHNLAAVDANGTTRWDLPLMPVTAMDVLDVDEDGGTDVAAGLRTGHVVAVDGENGNALLTPLRFKGNLRVIDSEASDPNDVWFLTEEGGVGRTRDGWNTLECVCDPVTGQIIQIPGAVSITRDAGGNVHVAHGDDLTTLTVTPDGVLTDTLNLQDRITFKSGLGTFTTDESTVYKLKAIESVGDALVALVDVPCTQDPAGVCYSFLMKSTNEGQSWGGFWSKSLKAVEHKSSAAFPAQPLSCNGVGSYRCAIVHESIVEILDLELAESEAVFDLAETETGARIAVADCQSVSGKKNCFLSTASGAFYVVENPWGPEETNVTESSGITTVVKAVNRTGDGVVYAAGDNAVYASWDGGHSFRRLHLPVGAHVPSAIHAFPNGQAYVMGGTSAQMQILVARSYQRVAEVHGAIPLEGEGHVTNVSLAATDRFLANSTHVNGSWIQYAVKDASGEWIPLTRLGTSGSAIDFERSPEERHAVAQSTSVDEFSDAHATHAPVRFAHAQDLDALEWRAILHASPDVPAAGPRIFNLTFAMDVVAPDTGDALAFERVHENFTDPATITHTVTTADVDATTGVAAAPLANLHWSQDVSGEVLDVLTADVTGDNVSEIIVGTGTVLKVTDPDAWSSDLDALFDEIGTDNRVYVLDPTLDGGIRWQSPSLDGKVTRVDLARDAKVNATVLATAVAENKTTRVYAFDAGSGAELWSHALNKPASVLTHVDAHLTRPDRPFAFPVVGTGGTSPRDDGTVFALDGQRGERAWRTAYGEVGHYRVPVTLGENALFGPHVVEIEVAWVDNVTGSLTSTLADEADSLGDTIDEVEASAPTADEDATAPVTENVTAAQSTVEDAARELVQAARYYNYFTSVPPNGRMPVSPVYALKIEAWLGEWDYATWTPTALDGDGGPSECEGDSCDSPDDDPGGTSGGGLKEDILNAACNEQQGSFCNRPAAR